MAIATSRNDDGYVRRQSLASDHDIAGESFEIQRAGQAGGNAVDRTRDKLDNRTPFFERLWPAMTTKGHTSYLRCFLDIVSPAMA